MNQAKIPRQRIIIDRRALAVEIAELVERHGAKARAGIVALLRGALDKGRMEIARRLAKKPSAGHECSGGQSFLIDQIIRLLHDHVTGNVYPSGSRSTSERLSIMAVGGYGRAEMAPHSDVDIAFITPARRTPWCEQVIEAMLYFLWDLGLQVGHSSRTVDEVVKMSKQDVTIRTAMLEGRFVWGDRELYDESGRRFWGRSRPRNRTRIPRRETGRTQNARHKRMGDSRYVVEPNVKDGKGGLRDLHTLYWIGKYIHKVRRASELVEVGLFTDQEYRSFPPRRGVHVGGPLSLAHHYRPRRGSADIRFAARNRRADEFRRPSG